MVKAFLSHSSKDKEIVSQVAKELGRQDCVFDKKTFSNGDEFIKAIEAGLNESSIFVFFASKSSLESIWVNFEQEEARFNKIKGQIKTTLVYIIDSDLDFNNIPNWLTRAKISRNNVPNSIARDIKNNITEQLRKRQEQYFIGRSNERDKIQNALVPTDGSPHPRAIILGGLLSIGRRTLIKKIVPDILQLKKFIEIVISEGDTLQDICFLLADYIEPYSTEDGLTRIKNEIQTLSDEDALDKIIYYLSSFVLYNQELVIFVDNDGILDSDGYLTESIELILKNLNLYDDAYLFLVMTRRPQNYLEQPFIYIPPLSSDDTKKLLARLANQKNIDLSRSELDELAEYVNGYPLAVHFAIEQAENYGVDILLKDKTKLVEFQTKAFLGYLNNQKLSATDREILQLLSSYSPLPLTVIEKVLNTGMNDLSNFIIKLIDLSLVLVNTEGYYEISPPIKRPSLSIVGNLPSPLHERVADTLSEFLSDSEENRKLSLYRVLFFASKRAGQNRKTISLISDLIRLVEDMYHSKRYSDAITWGYEAVKQKPKSKAQEFLIKALIREERWEDAEAQLQIYESVTNAKNASFLRGFLFRRQSNISSAIKYFERSKKLGRNDVALNRELGLCYFLNGEIAKAYTTIREAIERQKDNNYLWDILAQMALKTGDKKALDEALSHLEFIDPLTFFNRKSRVAVHNGNYTEAEYYAEMALESEAMPPFAVKMQLAYCQILVGKFDDADVTLGEIDRQYHRTFADIRRGVRCRLEIERGHYANALSSSASIGDKKSPFYKAIRRDALDGELKNSALNDNLRQRYKLEFDLLNRELINEKPYLPIDLTNEIID